MKVNLRDKLFNLLFQDKIISNKEISSEISSTNQSIQNNKILKRNFSYSRYENIKIDDNFKYYHFDLYGIDSKDFKYLYGENDNHESNLVLEHSFLDNLLKIKRSHDIILYKRNNVYEIYNGRHRLVYLSHYLKKLSLDEKIEIPAMVTMEFENERVNQILNILIRDYEAEIFKYNYYDNEVALSIIFNKNIYIINNATELEDFYTEINNSSNKYLYCQLRDICQIDFNELFTKIIEILKEKLFEMNFLDLLNFIKNNDINIDGLLINVDNIDITKFYNYYFNICNSRQFCKIHGYESPNDLGVLNAACLPINRFGHIIMEFLYENSFYQDFTWKELFDVIQNFTEFEGYDSDFLLESAKRFGYVEGAGKRFEKKKKNYHYW